jgi:hypothetical protein
MAKSKKGTTTVGQLEKALGALGKLVGQDVDEDILSKAMTDEEMGSEGEGGETPPPEEGEKKTPPPAKDDIKKAPPKKAPPKEEDDDEEDEDDEDEDSDEGEDGGEGEEGGDESDEGDGEDEEKSLRGDLMKSFSGNEEIEKAVDVSPFMEALVVQTVDSVDTVRKVLRKSLSEGRQFRAAEFQVLKGLALISKSNADTLDLIKANLEAISGKPLIRKSVSGSVAPVERVMGTDPAKGGSRMLAKSMTDLTKSFPTVKSITDDLYGRLAALDPNEPEAKAIGTALTQIDFGTPNPELFKSLGYDLQQ